MEDKCRVAQHSTGYLAGAFAAVIQAKQLVLTHFSARYFQQPGRMAAPQVRVDGPSPSVTLPCHMASRLSQGLSTDSADVLGTG